jgi:adenylate kinase
MLAKAGKKIEGVVSLEVPHEKLIERGSGRRSCPTCGAVYHVYQNPPKKAGFCDKDNTGLTQREDDKAEVIEKRLKKYDAETSPLKQFYAQRGLLKSIDGVGAPEGIYEELRKALGKA